MGLCKTSNFSIFTFITASDLKFCPHSYSSCVYHMMRFKGSNGKVCKMITHFRTLLLDFINDVWHKQYIFLMISLLWNWATPAGSLVNQQVPVPTLPAPSHPLAPTPPPICMKHHPSPRGGSCSLGCCQYGFCMAVRCLISVFPLAQEGRISEECDILLYWDALCACFTGSSRCFIQSFWNVLPVHQLTLHL